MCIPCGINKLRGNEHSPWCKPHSGENFNCNARKEIPCMHTHVLAQKTCLVNFTERPSNRRSFARYFVTWKRWILHLMSSIVFLVSYVWGVNGNNATTLFWRRSININNKRYKLVAYEKKKNQFRIARVVNRYWAQNESRSGTTCTSGRVLACYFRTRIILTYASMI